MILTSRKFSAPLAFVVALTLAKTPSHARAQHSSTHAECVAVTCEGLQNPLLWFQTEPNAQAVWAPFGTSWAGAKQFELWVKKSKESAKLPPLTNTLSLNCWEYVLYSALKLQRLSLAEVKYLYSIRTDGKLLSEHLGSTLGIARYAVRNSKIKITWPKELRLGDVVFMDETSHVVQLLGQRDSDGRELVVSFSPRPIWGDGSQEQPVPSQKPEVTTVEALIEEMMILYPDVPSDWDNVELKVVRPK